MKKQHKLSTASAGRISMPAFLRCLLDDLQPYLGSTHAPLWAAAQDPREFRLLVAQTLANADSSASVAHVAALRQVEASISKLPAWGASTPSDLRADALSKFYANERRCRITNKRISHFRKHPRRMSDLVHQAIFMAQDWIAKVLGGPPDFSMFSLCGFGPGLTFGATADERHLVYKVGGNQTVTPACRRLALDVLKLHFGGWFAHLATENVVLEQVVGNRVTFVPKTATSLRTIAIEPSLNVFLQKAVDEFMKRRLRTYGVRLKDQDYSTALIRDESGLALGVATIDLSNASDNIARELVRWLFPREWYQLLDALRSQHYTTDKGASWTRYEKFSSMGNATTFPVESMIFYALAVACCTLSGQDVTRVRVYGDDIIVPPESALLLIEVLRFCGFTTNRSKTFIFGRFRETCGVDILDGVDIRPVYIKEVPRSAPQVANLFNRFLMNRFGFQLDRTLSYLLSLVHRPLFGPAYGGFSKEVFEEGEWEEWYAGKSARFDAYFFSPPMKLRWSSAYQNTKYTIDTWHYPRVAVRGDWTEQTLFLLFLLGVEGGRPVCTGRCRLRRETFYGEWPDLEWWPSCYDDRSRFRTTCFNAVPAALLVP